MATNSVKYGGCELRILCEFTVTAAQTDRKCKRNGRDWRPTSENALITTTYRAIAGESVRFIMKLQSSATKAIKRVLLTLRYSEFSRKLRKMVFFPGIESVERILRLIYLFFSIVITERARQFWCHNSKTLIYVQRGFGDSGVFSKVVGNCFVQVRIPTAPRRYHQLSRSFVGHGFHCYWTSGGIGAVVWSLPPNPQAPDSIYGLFEDWLIGELLSYLSYSAFHPSGIVKLSTSSIHGPLWSGCQRRLCTVYASGPLWVKWSL